MQAGGTAAASGRRARLRRFLYQLRTERGGPRRDPLAVAAGVFIGCTPFYGLHLLLCIVTADLLRLNRLKVYLAANISNPLVAPFLIFAEVQAGSLIRRGHVHALTREAIASLPPWQFGLDLLVGAFAVGAVLAIAMGWTTYAALRRRREDPEFQRLVDRAAEPYAATSLTAWEFANGKLRSDPVYRTALDLLPGGDTLTDVGCGQGLMLALLAVDGRYRHLKGVEARPHVARLAREALGEAGVDILTADASAAALPPSSAVLLFDVLHLIPSEAQPALLARIGTALEPDGVVLVREADASAGARFTIVRLGNRLKAILGGRWTQAFAFRTAGDWIACFERAGFVAERFDQASSHPFANVLFRLRPRASV